MQWTLHLIQIWAKNKTYTFVSVFSKDNEWGMNCRMLRNKIFESEGTDLVGPLPSNNKKQDHWYLLLGKKEKKNHNRNIKIIYLASKNL